MTRSSNAIHNPALPAPVASLCLLQANEQAFAQASQSASPIIDPFHCESISIHGHDEAGSDNRIPHRREIDSELAALITQTVKGKGGRSWSTSISGTAPGLSLKSTHEPCPPVAGRAQTCPETPARLQNAAPNIVLLTGEHSLNTRAADFGYQPTLTSLERVMKEMQMILQAVTRGSDWE